VHRILAAAVIILGLLRPAAAIPKLPPPPDADSLQACDVHAEAMLDLLNAIMVVEDQLFGTPAWQRRVIQMEEGLADLPSPVVARFLAGKLQPLANEPGNQEYLTAFTAKRRALYEDILVHSNPDEMTGALLADATRLENMMAALPAEEHARLRFGQPDEFEQFDAARFRLWEVHAFVPCSSMQKPDLR
jgi:hypothetical protein